MAWSTPKLGDLAAAVRSAFRAEMPGTDATIWPNNLTPTAKVVAAALWGVYLKLDYLVQQIFAATAEGDFLDRHAAEFGLSRLPAAPSTGTMAVTSSSAGLIEVGALFSRADGATFSALERVIFLGASSTPVSVAIQAVTPGKAGNTLAGAALAVVSGATGVATAVVGTDGLGSGADLEGDDALRARVLFRKRNPPHGGAPADYVQWGLNVAGVSRVFIERLWAGNGSVRVFPVTDGLTAGGVPTAAIVAAVRNAIVAQAPATANVTVSAPVAQAINITIAGLLPNTAAVQQAVLDELANAFLRLGQVAGNDTAVSGMPYLATPQTFSRSWIWQAVANATGEERHSITLPAADVTISAGSIPTLGTVTFI